MKWIPDRLREAHNDGVFALVRRRAKTMALTRKAALVVAPHPDDETLGCGGMIALKRAQGVAVVVVILTGGESGPGRGEAGERGARELVSLRRDEARAATSLLGLQEDHVMYWDYPDGGMGAMAAERRAELAGRLAGIIRERHIGEVFVTHREDAHPDHEAAYAAARVAVDAVRGEGREVWLYQYVIWMAWSRPLLVQLRPSMLRGPVALDIGEVIAQKRRAIAEYRSQVAVFPAGFLGRFDAGREIYFLEVGG